MVEKSSLGCLATTTSTDGVLPPARLLLLRHSSSGSGVGQPTGTVTVSLHEHEVLIV